MTCKPKNQFFLVYKISRVIVGLIFSLVCLLLSLQALAEAGDVVTNRATATFTISGVNTVVESSPTGNAISGLGNGQDTSFTVDNRINFSVSLLDADEIPVQANQTDVVLAFQLTNAGNAIQDFVFTALDTVANPFTPPVDNFDPNNLRIFVESGATAGYQVGEDTAIFVDELNFDAGVGNTAIIYLVADIPAGQVTNDVAALALVAQVANGGNGSVQGAVIATDDAANINNVNSIDIVFADPAGANPEDLNAAGSAQDIANNGQASDAGAFIVAPPSVININKTNQIILSDDGTPHGAYLNASGVNRPGATIRYTLAISVDASFGDVTGIVITDDIPANTTYVAESIVLDTVAQTDADNIAVDFANYNSGTDQITVDITQAGAITVSADTNYTITFDVTIN